jgi:hypothetical protein
MLLEQTDLPGADWSSIGDRSWRPIFIARHDDVTRRARHTGAYVALRFFSQSTSNRSLWIQVAPFASSDDADARVPILRNRILNNPGRSVVKETVFDDRRIIGASRSTIFEQSSSGRGGIGLGRYAGGSVGNVAFMVACTVVGNGSPIDIWPWSDVMDLAELQANKIQLIPRESN